MVHVGSQINIYKRIFVLFLPHFLNSQIWLNQLYHHLSYITKLKRKTKNKNKRHCQTNILKKKLGGGEKLELKCSEFTSIGSSLSYVLQELVKFASYKIMMNGKYIV
jgi:hypothetical protein